MEPEEGKISRTTCADSYCVVEKWRGFERILPNKTKILRLWSAWGDEQENSRDSGGPGGMLKGTARTCWTAAAAAANLSQEKQRRIVRKAFRKLDKMNKKKEQADHTIRQQIQRIKELDREIERYEAKVHFDRIQRHGVNYVQDTYMVDCSAEDCARGAERQDARGTAEALAQLEEYARRCEEVVRLQEELTEREALVESITGEIQEELNRRWMKRRREERGAEAAKDPDCAAEDAPAVEPDVESLSDNELVLEEERIKTQLDTSLYIGLRLKADLDAIRGDLDLSLALWETKESELLDLLAKVETMDIEQVDSTLTEGGKAELGAVSAEAQQATEKSSGWVEQARGLSKACNTNDEDSDTGLSSMHSQDSDNPPVCESLISVFTPQLGDDFPLGQTSFPDTELLHSAPSTTYSPASLDST
ncbi:hypothetical protein L3Q82_007380 [Scortum barcoo]|uniref:Uncharacterized protein n=1 Tax=Scortum barcoo TaxID=214431 RepID=A0ACB8WSN6_9TELE|nr:hypothetical protein L3Q82_007380 [Scortum barcoo]